MSAVDSIINFKRDPNEDFYAMLNCDENSSVSEFYMYCFFINNLNTIFI